jgi:hypothetical protein
MVRLASKTRSNGKTQPRYWLAPYTKVGKTKPKQREKTINKKRRHTCKNNRQLEERNSIQLQHLVQKTKCDGEAEHFTGCIMGWAPHISMRLQREHPYNTLKVT